MHLKKLQQYRFAVKEIPKIKRKLYKLYDQLENIEVVMGKVTGSSKDFPYTKVRTSVQMDSPKEAQAIKDRIARYEAILDDTEVLKQEVEDFIANIKESQIRLIFTMLYVDGRKQIEVAREVGYTQGRISQIVAKTLKD